MALNKPINLEHVVDIATLALLLLCIQFGVFVRDFERGGSFKPVAVYFCIIAMIIIGKILRAS